MTRISMQKFQSLTSRMRKDADDMFAHGVKAADPRAAVIQALETSRNSSPYKAPETNDTSQVGLKRNVRIMAVGKAAIPMTLGALDCIPKDQLSATPLVVTSYENLLPGLPMRILGAGHPIPNNDGLLAATLVAEKTKSANANELILALISGGASALLPMPPPSISLSDKISVTELLLASGADIHEINTVRKHLSKLKGGGLAQLAQPAPIEALILSDVLDDNLETIASGLTVGDSTTFSDAIEVIRRRDIWQEIPATVRTYLLDGQNGLVPETPTPDLYNLGNVRNTVIGSNRISLEAVCKAAYAKGYEVEILSEALIGSAQSAAENFVTKTSISIERPRAYVAGGETTVFVHGNGRGGRNQELALTFATLAPSFEVRHQTWVFLSGGTDGIDGPTDAAGGIVDSGTIRRIEQSGQDVHTLLADNDSYRALGHSRDLLVTGATGTNVADLQILLVHPH